MSRKMQFSRRDALQAGAFGMAGAALLPILGRGSGFDAVAKAPMLGVSQPSHYRFKLGGFEITTVLDGAITLKGPYPIFGADQIDDDVAELAKKNFLPSDKMQISFTPVIVNTGKEVILFDTGNGAGRRGKGAGLIRGALGQVGYKPEDIDIVVITHCHPDHIGGLIEAGKPAFPKARYVIGETEYAYWSKIKGGRRGALVQANVVPLAAKMTFLKDDGEVVPGVRAVASFGHTPGHLAFQMESSGKRLLLWGDVTNHYVASLQRPDWHVRFDMDKEGAAATRKKILDMAAAERMLVTGYHMPFPAIGFVEKKDGAYRWVPVSYQTRL